MAELHKNLIDGEWVGTDGVENINPSNTAEVVGLYARAFPRMVTLRYP
jgi:aldehyde dehydrogenase (NAD+)